MVDQARSPKELLLNKTIHIWLLTPPLNWNGGLELPGCWMHIAALKDREAKLPATFGDSK